MSLEPETSLFSNLNNTLPRLRHGIDFSVSHKENGQTFIVLQDTWELHDNQMLISYDLLFILHHMNGQHSIDQIKKAYKKNFSAELDTEYITKLISMLDEFYLLDNARFTCRLRQLEHEYNTQSCRQPVCAGSSYPAQPAELTAFLDTWFDDDIKKQPPVSALVVPHIDMRMGETTYSAAYKYLKAAPQADLYVILGIGHKGIRNLFSVSDKDFDTPLGVVHTDKALVNSILQSAHYDFSRDQLVHRDEHSIEFQTVILQYLFGQAAILPVLSSFSPDIFTGHDSCGLNMFNDFVATLRNTLAQFKGSICYIAAVDFAHIGPAYDPGHKVNDQFLSEYKHNDLQLIDALIAWDFDAFQHTMLTTNDRYHICGYSALATLLHLAGPQKGQLLDYRSVAMDDSGSRVSFAGLIY